MRPAGGSSPGKEYLYIGEQSKGPRSPETEKEFESYTTIRDGIKARFRSHPEAPR